MKILFVNTNRFKNNVVPPPVAFMYLSAPLKAAGHNLKFIDLMFIQNPNQTLEQEIVQFNPSIVCYTLRNMDNQDMLDLYNPLPEIKEFITIAKNHQKVSIIGGTAFSTFPKMWLEYTGADYGIAGQAEKSIAKLVDGISNGNIDFSLQGLVFRQENTVFENPADFSGYVDTTADWDVIDYKGYSRNSLLPVSSVIKTGCRYRCAYCDVTSTMGRSFIFRNTELIIEDLKIIKNKLRLSNIFFVDPCFNIPLDKSKEVLEAIIKSGLKIYFSATIKPERRSFDDEYFKLLKKAGGVFIMLGAEGFSETMLRSYRKSFHVPDIIDCLKLCKKNGIQVGVEALFGGPGETQKTILQSMDIIRQIDYSLFLYGIGVRIMPRTAIYDIAKKEGFFEKDEELFFPKFYFSPLLDLEWTKSTISKTLNRYKYRQAKMGLYGFRLSIAKYFGIYY